MPKILFICSALQTGGAERLWAILVPQLARRGFTPRVLTLTGRGRFFDELEAAGVDIGCARLKSRFDVGGVVRIIRSARTARPDLVVTQEINAHVIGAVVAAACRVPHVAIDHTPFGLPRARHRRALTRLIAPHVDALVAVGMEQIPDLTGLGYANERITVISNGVPDLRPDRSRADVLAELGLPETAWIALLVASLRRQKRAELFVSAVTAAHAADQRIVGVVVGGGPEFDVMHSLAGSSGGAVLVLGERRDVADLMHASDVACFTSAMEGLPMVALEAMALARPVVAMRVPGIEEAVVDGETGVLVESGDVESFANTLVRLSRAPETVARLGAGGRSRYERLYGAERMVEGYERLFARVLRQGTCDNGAV